MPPAQAVSDGMSCNDGMFHEVFTGLDGHLSEHALLLFLGAALPAISQHHADIDQSSYPVNNGRGGLARHSIDTSITVSSLPL